MLLIQKDGKSTPGVAYVASKMELGTMHIPKTNYKTIFRKTFKVKYF